MKHKKFKHTGSGTILIAALSLSLLAAFVYSFALGNLPASASSRLAEINSIAGSQKPNFKNAASRAARRTEPTEAVTVWNIEAARLAVLPASALAPVQQTRVMAIVQLSVHDAVNGITGEFDTYLPRAAAPVGASPEAAAIAASHHALLALFPSQSASLNALFLQTLDAQGLSLDNSGIGYGQIAAAPIIAVRANDKAAAAQFDYTVPGAGIPGVWTRLNNAAALLPGWGKVTPFVLNSGSQFRPDPPPAIHTEQYTKDFNEVKRIGSLNGSTRTQLQTDIASFWRGSPTAIWNPVLNQAAAAHDLDISELARIFALFYMAASDSSVACWDAKYSYNYWRPMPAIRGGDLDRNPATVGDPAWTPLFPTPPHPEYPSGHSCNSSAMASTLQKFFTNDPGIQIQVTLSGITRTWDSFEQPLDEVIDARVYSGLHFRTADEVGARLGSQVAQFVSTHALRRCLGPVSRCY